MIKIIFGKRALKQAEQKEKIDLLKIDNLTLQIEKLTSENAQLKMSFANLQDELLKCKGEKEELVSKNESLESEIKKNSDEQKKKQIKALQSLRDGGYNSNWENDHNKWEG